MEPPRRVKLRRTNLIVAFALGVLVAVAPPVVHGVIPNGNLIQNPGAEEGPHATTWGNEAPPPQWTVNESQISQVAYGTGQFPTVAQASAANAGSAFFVGRFDPDRRVLRGDTGGGHMSQAIDLEAIEEIDTGNVAARLEGLLGGVANHAGVAEVHADFFDDDSDTPTLELQIGPVTAADRDNQTTMLRREDSGVIPPVTDTVFINVIFTPNGNDPTGFADNLSLTLADAAAPVVRTTGVDAITTTGARLNGTIDSRGRPRTYHFEYGPTIAYGSRTADATTSSLGDQSVQATIGSLAPGTTYHARLVSEGVGGEDITFRTASDPVKRGLPGAIDFTWSPRAEVMIAGAPAGGVLFQATPGDGVRYEWDFDHKPDAGFRADGAAGGPTPRHGFTADGAHSISRVRGADGQRRRVYSVKLRATAENGASTEVAHDLVVMPNSPPKVDFTIERSGTGVNETVALRPFVSDPDATPRTADAIDRIEWDFDSPGAAGGVDLVCDGDGTNCRTPDGGAPPGAWFSTPRPGSAGVNFFTRALAGHGLRPLSGIDLDALPSIDLRTGLRTGGIQVKVPPDFAFFVQHDPRLSFLYQNATLIQQSNFNDDAGEATGATLTRGFVQRARPRADLSLSRSIAQTIGQLRDLQFRSRLINWRQATLTAVDTAGARTSITHSVPLTRDGPPELSANFVNRNPKGGTTPSVRLSGSSTKDILPFPLTTNDELAFDASATRDPEGKMAWYTLEVGKPITCTGRPAATATTGPISLDGPPDGFGPAQFFPRPPIAASGPRTPVGPVGALPIKASNSVNMRVGFAAQANRVKPPIAQLLQQRVLGHPCIEYGKRNVTPESFKTRPSSAVRPAELALRRPTARAAQNPNLNPRPRPPLQVDRALLDARQFLEYDTTAIVTRDPKELRFRIPREGRYSVAVAAYDESGQGAIQRTDGFVIQKPSGVCQNVTGEALKVSPTSGPATRTLGFSGQCVDYGANRRRFWTSREISVNGISFKPENGAKMFINTTSGDFLATRASNLGTASLDTIRSRAAGATIVVDREPIADFATLSTNRAAEWFNNVTSAAPPLIANATYKGSPVSRAATPSQRGNAFDVQFEADGRSTAVFSVVLPSEFNADGGPGPTSEVVRRGVDEPRVTELETNRFAEIASHRKRKARASQIEVKGTGIKIDLSGKTVGPVSIKQGFLEFDPAQGYFHGIVREATIQLATQQPKVSFEIIIQNGSLRKLSGRVTDAKIPIVPGVVDLTGVRFSIVTDPLVVTGGASFAAVGGLLNGDLDITVRPKPVFFRLEGKIRVSELELARAFVQYDQAASETLSFGGHFGYDFGPASMNADLAGAISFKTDEFFIEGGGRSCMFICFGIRGLVSNLAVAACGEIDLLLDTISAGFAYRFKGGLKLFSGCDLSPYRPAIFRTRAGPRAAGPDGGVVTVPPNTESVALRFVGQPGMGGAPRVVVTGPDGRVYSTAPGSGDYAFTPGVGGGLSGDGTARAGTALIDQDTVDHVTSMLIARPAGGNYTIALEPGQPPLVATEMSTGREIPDATLQTAVAAAQLQKNAVKIGNTRFQAASSGGARSAQNRITVQQFRALRALPTIERKRLRGVVINVPAGLTGKMTLLDASPTSIAVVGELDLAKAGRQPFAFDPTMDPGRHELRAFLTHTDGTPRDSIVIDSFEGPSVPSPSEPEIDLHRDGNGDIVVDVKPGTAGALKGRATTMELVAQTTSGKRIERVIDSRDVTQLKGGEFRVNLGDFARSERLTVSTRMIYGTIAGVSARDILASRP